MDSSENDGSASRSAGDVHEASAPQAEELERLPMITPRRRVPSWAPVLPAAFVALLIGLVLFGHPGDPVDPTASPIGFNDDGAPGKSGQSPPPTGSDAPDEDLVPAHGAVYREGKLYLGGAVPSRKVANALVAKAAEVIGAANVVDEFVIDPNTPKSTYGRVSVDEPFLFESKSAEISDEYITILDLGVTAMTLNPKVTMVVIGHTDSVGAAKANQRLSVERTEAVATYMVQRGIDRSRFELVGKGESEPIADNQTLAGRNANNRIEVVLLNLLAD